MLRTTRHSRERDRRSYGTGVGYSRADAKRRAFRGDRARRPVGREPANQLPGPGAGCTDEPSVTVDPAQPRARIRLAVMDENHPRRVYSFQLSRELRATGRPLPPPHIIDLRTMFPERIREATMAPGDYPITLELGPQRETVTLIVGPPR
jgi:hypothetical protein